MNKKPLALHISGLLLSTLAPAVALGASNSTFVIEEVVVTAQKRAESSQDVPISIQAFSADAIERLGATQLLDLAKSAPSLSTGGIPGSNQTCGMRGVVDYGRNIGIDSRMGVYIDGVYQGRSSSNNQPLMGLESVEILRGPQGTLFGKNTVSGAINLNTRKASEDFTGELKAGLGNEGYMTASALLSGPLGDKVLGSIAYSTQKRDGWFNNTALGRQVGDWEQDGARGQLRFLANEKLEVILSGDFGSSDSEMPVYTRQSLPIYTTGKSLESDKVDFWGTALTANYNTDSDYILTSISAYRTNEYVLTGDEDFTAAAAAFQTQFDEKGKQFSQEFRVVSPQNDTYDWVAGLYYFDSRVSTGRNILFGAPILPAPQLSGVISIPSVNDITSYAFYVHGNYRITEQLELTAGLRFTDEEKDFDFNQVNTPNDAAGGALVLENGLGLPAATAAFLAAQSPGSLFQAFNLNYRNTYNDSNWSPTLGLNYQTSADVMYYAKYSRGYQSGGFNGDFNPYLPAIQFNSEYVDAFEIGVKSVIADGALQLNADVFVQKYADFQLFQRVPVGASSVQIVSNAGKVTSQGLELETVWLPTDTLQLTVNATYLDATYDQFENPVFAIDPTQPANYNGNYLNNAPQLKLFASLQYIQPLGDAGSLTFDVDYSYQDESFSNAPNNVTFELIPDYDLWNGRITFNPASDRWSVSAWVKNIGDSEYIINHSQASITNINRVIWGAPRLIGMEFKLNLGQ